MEIPLAQLTRELGAYFVAVWLGALLLAGAVAGLAALWKRLSSATASRAAGGRGLLVANPPQP